MHPEGIKLYETHRVTKWLQKDDRVLCLAEKRGLVLKERENLYAAFSLDKSIRDKGKYIYIKEASKKI